MSLDALHVEWKTLLHGSLSGDLEKLCSHPNKKLIDHLTGTAALAQKMIDAHGLENLARCVALAAYTHDLGKADPSFQERLKGRGKKVEHSAPSSFFTLSRMGDEPEVMDCFFAAEAVRRHHSGIEDWGKIYNHWFSQENSALSIVRDMKKLLPHWPSFIDDQQWECFTDMLLDLNPGDGIYPADWLKLRSILSLLVAGDRLNAIGVDNFDFLNLPAHQPVHFENADKQKETSVWRAKIAEECFENALTITKPGIFSLTLPTGAGKTNVGLKIAHIIAQNLGYQTLIYALPFIGIVEQNAAFAKEVFGTENVQEDHSLILTTKEDEKKEQDEDNTKYSWKKAMRLFRYWGAPVVVTTMAQLWDTLFNPRASATIDFHRLSRAVVLMDEPQGIDSRYWKGLGDALHFIHEKWGTVFILMTATQPHIGKGQELAPPTHFPLNRHRYRFLKEKHRLEELPALLEAHLPDFKEKSGMLIFNTRKSAWDAYQLLKPLFEEAPVFVLSRWMSLQHRRCVLAKIKQLQKEGQRHYLIATQVVEAGIDLDFDWIFRDLAPMDNIIQAAGRCNRSGMRTLGSVLIAELQNENGKSFGQMIYDPIALNETQRILENNPEFEDEQVTQIVDTYYHSLVKKINPKPLWENITNGAWGEYLSLYPDNYCDITVYVDHDGEIDIYLEQLRNLERTLPNRDQLKKLQSTLQQYSIGVSPTHLEAWIGQIGAFVSEGQEMLEACGDDYYIIRQSGIGKGDDMIYHPTAGFHPCFKGHQEEFW